MILLKAQKTRMLGAMSAIKTVVVEFQIEPRVQLRIKPQAICVLLCQRVCPHRVYALRL